MHVDDRLATVLGARVESVAARRIQYRQLLDLVGTAPAGERGEQLDAAFVRLAELANELPAEDRARALGEPGVRLRNPRLVAELAADAPAVALAAIRAARLDGAQWLDLLPALPLAARGLLRHRRDLDPAVAERLERLGVRDRALPSTEAEESGATGDTPSPEAATLAPVRPRLVSEAAPPHGDGIGALVRRIEAFRRSRQGTVPPQAANDAPRLPLGEREADFVPLAVFAFATDPAGRIVWTDAPAPGMLIGLNLGRSYETDATPGPSALAPTLRQRLPIRNAAFPITGAPACAGDWLVDATPDFDEAGRFAGYLGWCRRPAPPAARAVTAGDRMRQILHELKTPVNAIQGFAEVIQQQLFGATPHEYRALAAGIAGDAARLLAGFDELDRWARLDSGVLEREAGACDLAMVVAGLVHQLESYTTARSSGFTLAADPGEALVPLTTADAERMIWRLLATCAGFARPGESVELSLRRGAGLVRLAARLPEALRDIALPADAPTLPAAQAISAGIFGTAFTFRLLAAEARHAGGVLAFDKDEASLTLPEAQAAPLAADCDAGAAADGHAHGNGLSCSSTERG